MDVRCDDIPFIREWVTDHRERKLEREGGAPRSQRVGGRCDAEAADVREVQKMNLKMTASAIPEDIE